MTAEAPSEDDLETRAMEWMLYASHFGLIAEILNGRWTSEQVTDMARGVLILLTELRARRVEHAELRTRLGRAIEIAREGFAVGHGQQELAELDALGKILR